MAASALLIKASFTAAPDHLEVLTSRRVIRNVNRDQVLANVNVQQFYLVHPIKARNLAPLFVLALVGGLLAGLFLSGYFGSWVFPDHFAGLLSEFNKGACNAVLQSRNRVTEVVKDVVNKLICSEGCPLKSPMELPALLVACIMFPVIIYCYYRVVDFLIHVVETLVSAHILRSP